MTATTPARPDGFEGELRLDRLLGRPVLAANHHRVGRLEEIRVQRQGGEWIVSEYVIGAGGLLERLDLGVRLLLGRRTHGHVARWDQLDITEPTKPRLLCPIEELRPL